MVEMRMGLSSRVIRGISTCTTGVKIGESTLYTMLMKRKVVKCSGAFRVTSRLNLGLARRIGRATDQGTATIHWARTICLHIHAPIRTLPVGLVVSSCCAGGREQ